MVNFDSCDSFVELWQLVGQCGQLFVYEFSTDAESPVDRYACKTTRGRGKYICGFSNIFSTSRMFARKYF
jgi:hypothetical protein